MNTLNVYRSSGSLVATINIDEKTVYSKKLMGEHKITSEFYSNVVIPLQINDYITYNSEDYFINRIPNATKINESTYLYKVDFEAVVYNLNKKLFRSSDGLCEFPYNGTATDFVTMIISNINEIDADYSPGSTNPGWSIGTIYEPTTPDYRTMQFTNESCRAALMRVAETFKLEFQIIGRQISMVKSVGNTTSYTFEYGMARGLYKITRQQVQDQNILTKVYGYGGTTNIGPDYRNRAKRLVFESNGNRFLTKNTDLYGIIEGQFTDDEIYPKRTGIISAAVINFSDGLFVPATSYVADSGLDFDLNNYLIKGSTATIVFKSGDLAGVECEIWKYDAVNKRIYFNPNSDADGYTTPNYNGGSSIQPAVGDTYTLINIKMPQPYIDEKELELKNATQAYIDENCVPMVVYGAEFDPKYARSLPLVIDVGDRVTILDTSMGINNLIRISGIEFPLVDEYRIKAVIADFVPYTLQERLIKTTIQTKKETVFVDRKSAELARRNTMRQGQLKNLLFDANGEFSPTGVSPLWVSTLFLEIGSQASDFRLSSVTIKPNHESDPNKVYISAGQLVHFQLKIGTNYIWTIASPATFSSLTPSSAYYLYAKCSQSAMTGSWDLSTEQKPALGDDGYFYFFVGILYSVLDDIRDFDFGYGMTYINGRIITTGRIRSIDGLNFFDLDQNQFMMGDASHSLDWNVTAPGTLTLRGALVQSPGGTTAPILVNVGTYDAGTTYHIGEQVTYGGSTWNWINPTPASGHTPADDAYWDLASSGAVGPAGPTGPAGADGVDGTDGSDGAPGSVGPGVVYRGDFSAATAYFNNSLRRDIVKYSGTYYLFKGTDNTSAAWSAGNWESFGATFSSVATDILFASLAYIDNLGVKHLRTGINGKRVEINTDNLGNINVYSTAGTLVAQIGAEAFAGLPGIKVAYGYMAIQDPYSLEVIDGSGNRKSSFDARRIKMPNTTTINRANIGLEAGTLYFDTTKQELCLYTQGAWWHVTLHADH